MKDPRDIILAPVVSEKSYALIEQGVYTFKVHPSASKPEIHDAVEAIWGVQVVKVNTLNRPGKVTRRGHFTAKTSGNHRSFIVATASLYALGWVTRLVLQAIEIRTQFDTHGLGLLS